MPRVFISHSTKDREFVERHLLPLLQENGIEPWYAPDDIDPTTRWERTILGGLQACDWFLLVMSPRAAASEWVRDEVAWAISHRDGRIVPVMLEACDPYAFHIRMPRIQHIDFGTNPESARQRLLVIWGVTPSPNPSTAEPFGPTADPVTDYANWKQQIEELTVQAEQAAKGHDYERAVAILETIPTKRRDNEKLAEWTRKRDLWTTVETGWQEMSDAELEERLEEILRLHPGHPRAKPWLEQFGTPEERRRKKLRRGKVGHVISNSLGMKFAWVPPGTSWLGGGGGKPGTRRFTLEQGLWCGVYPVTQAEWEAVMGTNPSRFKGNPRYPVENVSCTDIDQFLKRLNDRLEGGGLSYRLPTEEEWEYICRGGPISQNHSAYHFYFAQSREDLSPAPTNDLSSTQANFDGNHPAGSAAKGPYLKRPCDVGLYLPNPLGICDLHGNVWEWTSTSAGSARVIRGGGFSGSGGLCAAPGRGWDEPDDSYWNIGFRLLAVPSS